jgi:16S rRNA (guanine527-N7)-methyltransferase
MSDWLDTLRAGATSFGLTITAEQEAQFARFLELLLAKNQVMNLTAITDPGEVAIKHFLDSLTVELAWAPQPEEQAIDIGTGAGFPGLPLAIRHPQTIFILNDSVRKKVEFLDEVTTDLGLTNALAILARAEELGQRTPHRGRYDVALARAVAHLAVLIEYGLPLVRDGGWLIAMKGPSGPQEVAESRPALQALGGTVETVKELTLPTGDARTLVVVRKVGPTPAKYPRDAAAMKKKPLMGV